MRWLLTITIFIFYGIILAEERKKECHTQKKWRG